MITITPSNQNLTPNPSNRMPPFNSLNRGGSNVNSGGRANFFQPFRAYRQGGNGPVVFDPEFDGKRLRKSAMRKTVDYNAAIIKMLEARVWQRGYKDQRSLQPDVMYIPDLMPPSHYLDNSINAVTTRFVKTATNKMRCPIFCMAWTPEGRRLVTGASSGEFTLWNGLTFNFETILQAHDTPVRTMVWSHNEMWMVTADHAGFVKYWQSNMNNVKMFMAHQEAIRGISFSPLDSKFASCSDDGTIKIWDFYRCQEERALRGHGADVKCVHWHPQKGLIISGSKDNQQPVKLWDPKTGTSLATIHAHKSTVMDVKWNNNGNWFVTASRDHLLKLFDLRNLNTEVQVFRGHKKESSSVAWHPTHEGLFCSGGSDGAILFWHVGAEKEVGAIEQAHDSIVWTLAWHPMGHILCSGSNDHTSKFWTRNRPGDTMRDKYNLNTLPASLSGLEETEIEDVNAVIPGMGPDDKVEVIKDINVAELPGLNPGSIPGLEDIDLSAEEKAKTQSKKVPYSKPIPKNFQAHWNDTGKLDELDDDSKDNIDPMAILNQLIEQQPGVKLVKDLEPEALYIYGKVLTVEPGSMLSKMICEGGDKLMKYLNSGAVKELRDVIPHYDNDNCDAAEFYVEDSDEDSNALAERAPSEEHSDSPHNVPPMLGFNSSPGDVNNSTSSMDVDSQNHVQGSISSGFSSGKGFGPTSSNFPSGAHHQLGSIPPNTGFMSGSGPHSGIRHFQQGGNQDMYYSEDQDHSDRYDRDRGRDRSGRGGYYPDQRDIKEEWEGDDDTVHSYHQENGYHGYQDNRNFRGGNNGRERERDRDNNGGGRGAGNFRRRGGGGGGGGGWHRQRQQRGISH